ncbi:hypothetical protein DU504_06100 [Haloplanus salinus]|uniref:Uncharacterized protein n=1 Tax=Haloplanus salinus TaxID=1126245 RepID=A0A368N9I7_9EURY|nr:DUF5809 family protein [Haloplanus salinus]RCU46916.1 hypothetical protein DU504_06100 [Haloplanus salinus]
METEGVFAPETLADAREAYESVGPAAQTVVRETATAMDFDGEEYRERVTSDVVETARDAMFASLLVVHVGDWAAFEDWRADAAVDVTLLGSEDVDGVVRHVAPFADAAVAATYQDERDAAVATCRRAAFGRLYRDAL